MSAFRILPPLFEIDTADPFEKNIFNLEHFPDNMTKLVTSVQQPLVIALDGEWGSGKSTFLKQWKAKLEKESAEVPVIYFDAFENDYVEDAFAALAREVIALLDSRRAPVSWEFKKRAVACGTILLKGSLRLGIKASVRALTLNTVRSEDLAEIANDLQSESADMASAFLEELLDEPNKQRQTIQEFRDALSQLSGSISGGAGGTRPLVFIIDELDRCRPAFALAILERIKHFMSVPNVHFVLGVHLEQLRNSVCAEYGAAIEANLYLQKFISITLSMPVYGQHKAYLDYLKSALPISSEARNYMDVAVEHLLRVARYRDFSLRTLEKVYSTLLVYTLFTNDKQRKAYFVVSTLCAPKVVAPNHYKEAKLGTLSFKTISSFLGLEENSLDDTSKKWEVDAWHHMLDVIEPETSDISKISRGFSNRRDMVPYIVEQIDGLMA